MPKDLFSKQAETYLKYRPSYPESLIAYILSFVEKKETAWDVATGNGQAAIRLAPHFDRVFATDSSERQIQHALPHARISYAVGYAEDAHFPDNCFDLISVAQAYHWFDFNGFSREAWRTGKQDAIIAVWGYGLLQAADKDLNGLIGDFYSGPIKQYWDPERRYVEEEYQTVPFPFDEIPSARFTAEVHFSWEDLIGLLNSWSSVQQFIRSNQHNPVDQIQNELRRFWINQKKQSFSFPLFMRLGRLNK